MSSANVYELVSPSVPFIETGAATGSGVLIQGGYVITNYHVVWPYEAAWVIFPDGTELQAPVVGWDPMTDLAVLGPVNVSANPLELTGGESLAPGSELYLVGYPAELERFPQPTITQGILARKREWERPGITFLQTDAAIAGGQSGGALVNSEGEVVGVSGFAYSEARFGLAASSADIMPIVEQLIQGQHVSGLGDRRLPAGPGAFSFDMELDNPWATESFVLNGTAGTTFQVETDGLGDGEFQASGPTGLLGVDQGYVGAGVEAGAAELPVDGAYFLQVRLESGDFAISGLTSSIRLQPLHDPDDEQVLSAGQAIAASLDHPADLDWYSIRLNEGETVRITTDSLLADTSILVDFPGSRSSQVVFDDDSGGGLFGTNSELVYRAPNTGEYFIVVGNAGDTDLGGGYYLSVEPARAGTETVYVQTGSQAVESRYGKMMRFEGPGGEYQVQVPETWIKEDVDLAEGEILFRIEPNDTGFVSIVEESLEGYADLTESLALVPEGSNVLGRSAGITSQGIPFVEIYGFQEDLAFSRFICLLDNGLAVNITYGFLVEELEQYLDLVEYSYSSMATK